MLMLALSILPAQADIADTIRKLAPNAIVLVVDEKDEPLVAQSPDKPFTPASIAKIVTGWMALTVLGSDYRFQTRFHMDEDRKLYVRGGGDPFLVSEEFAMLVPALLEKTGSEPFSGIVLDTSYFPKNLQIPGIEPDDEAYNALNVALAANFNTIHAVRKGNSVRSAEKQTPITPLAIEQFKRRGPKGRGRISLSQEDPSLGARYAGELLAEFIRMSDGKIDGEIIIGRIPDGLEPVYIHRQSRPLSDIVRLMLLGSNNYIANQLFLEAGAQPDQGEVSIERSLSVLGNLLSERNFDGEVNLLEGSGISKQNRVTAAGFAEVLKGFAPHAELLKKTRRGSRYKTGTLDNVSTLAGYVKTQNHGMARFVIALPGRTGKLRFNILSAMEKQL